MLAIANWKMKLDVLQSVALAQAMVKSARHLPQGAEVVLCPTFLSLAHVAAAVKGSTLRLGAQDCFWETQGAFTGEVSPADLRQLNCQYVILGHSERREHMQETDGQVHRKLEAALRTGLTPVLCIGENYQERSGSQKDYVLIRQLQAALQGVTLGPDDRLVVAYEPVWAISTGGTGIEATPDEVQYASEVIRHIIIDLYGAAVLQRSVQIVYGGSVNPSNVASFTQLPTLHGVLVGSASLDAATFLAVISAALNPMPSRTTDRSNTVI